MKKILVNKGKYETLYYDISKNRGAAYFDLFKYFDECGYYQNLEIEDASQYREELAEMISFNQKEIPKSLVKYKQQEIIRLEAIIKNIGNVNEQRKLYLRAKAGNKNAAYQLVLDRSDENAEYESVSEEFIREIE